MIRCDQCDNEVIAGWHFCPYCGYPLTDEEIEAAQRELTARQQAQETIYKLSRQIADTPYHPGEGVTEPARQSSDTD
jgi:uncharacterized Zn finger protein (UPF0148 family)